MNDMDKTRLRINRSLILQEVRIEHVRDFLYQEGIISEEDMDRCGNVTKTPRERIACLLDLLPRRGPEAYKAFCSGLQETYPWVVEKLNSTPIPETQTKTLSSTVLPNKEMNTGETSERQRIREPYTELNHTVIKIVTRSEALNKYKDVVRALGVPQPDIDQIEYANFRDLQEQFYQCLLKWQSREGRNATVVRLIEVLREEDYNSVADKLDGYID
ncbi:death domain-containing protein CRADD-like [Liolophura sinensis]|uniref:death domain-containing protein CRADD-like n=1 Tax=Liolophura sinensis TaxID=3198878 RepID=UPI003158AE0E